MIDSALKYFSDHWPNLTGIFCVIVLAAWGIIYITMKILHWIGRVNEAHKKCDDVEARIDSQVLPKLNGIDANVNNLTTTVTTLGTSINGLIIYLKGKDGSMDTSLFRTMSPTQLTTLGEQILAEAGGKVFIDDNIDMLLEQISGQNIKTALDVQTVAPMVITNMSVNDKFTPIKDFIYKNPQYKVKPGEESVVSLDMNVMTNIMGIYKYLEKHPELDPSE
jgi:hypothetical protein